MLPGPDIEACAGSVAAYSEVAALRTACFPYLAEAPTPTPSTSSAPTPATGGGLCGLLQAYDDLCVDSDSVFRWGDVAGDADKIDVLCETMLWGTDLGDDPMKLYCAGLLPTAMAVPEPRFDACRPALSPVAWESLRQIRFECEYYLDLLPNPAPTASAAPTPPAPGPCDFLGAFDTTCLGGPLEAAARAGLGARCAELVGGAGVLSPADQQCAVSAAEVRHRGERDGGGAWHAGQEAGHDLAKHGAAPLALCRLLCEE